MTKDDRTNKDVESLFQNIVSLLDLFNDLKLKVSRIENLIEGKASEGISSLYLDVQNLKTSIKDIESKLKTDIVDNMNTLKNDVREYSKVIDDIDKMNEKIHNLELFKESKHTIEKFLSYVVPFLSFGLAIIASLLIPIFKR
jgi:gas vesicle protein